MNLSDREKRQLDETGFLILDGFMDKSLLAELRLAVEQRFTEEGERAGEEFKKEPGCRRLANLVDKGDVFRRIINLPRILQLVRHVLGDRIKLSSLNARSVNPGGAGRQPLHADMGALADAQGFWVCNTVWMLDDYSATNGALRVVPGSHRWGRLPLQDLADPLAVHAEEVLVTGTAGSVVVMNAHLWHGGLGNQTERPRTSVHAFYCRWDKPQQQYQKRLVRPEVQQMLPPSLRELLALDDPLNDRLSAEVAIRSGFLK